jgi:hypothetical protein
MTARRLEVARPVHGWEHPWPNAFEVARVFSTDRWTLIGGLMVQAHSLAHDVPVIRPTDDLDLLLHIELVAGVTGEAHRNLENLGYVLNPPTERKGHVYRYQRRRAGEAAPDVIDVLAPDHLGPHHAPRLHNSPMFVADGGKQALNRTMTLAMISELGHTVEFSVPDELGALVLKGAAYLGDRTRERTRHLSDAAVLAACITDHAGERARLKGSDRKRLGYLYAELNDPRHPAWLQLPEPLRVNGQDTLRILLA